MQTAGVDVLYYGGYSTEAALVIRQARDRGYDLQLVSGDFIYTEQFWLVAGPAANGALFTSPPEPREKPEAAEVVSRFRAANYEPEGGTLHTYASVQVWAQAVEKAGTTELNAVVKALRSHTFDTVVGRISFDDNGDVTGTETYISVMCGKTASTGPWNRACWPTKRRAVVLFGHPDRGSAICAA